MFTFLLVIVAVLLLSAVALAVTQLFESGSYSSGGYMIGAMACGSVGLVLGFMATGYWEKHAADLGTIEAQHEVIAVYQQRIDRLTERLESFNYRREDAQILLNADSPVAAVVAALTEAEGQLAAAEAQRAVAMRSIEQRRRGPWKGVISYAGDYK